MLLALLFFLSTFISVDPILLSPHSLYSCYIHTFMINMGFTDIESLYVYLQCAALFLVYICKLYVVSAARSIYTVCIECLGQ